MDIEINNNFKQVYAPMLLKSKELFKANGDVEYLPYAAVPVRCYLISEHKDYLSNGKSETSYLVVPLWDQKNMDGAKLKFNADGYCTNNTVDVAKYYLHYEDCKHYCEFVLNPTIMDIRLRDWQGREVRTVFNRIEIQQKEAFDLAKQKDDEILGKNNNDEEISLF